MWHPDGPVVRAVRQNLQPEYCANRDRLRGTFPVAFDFLSEIESGAIDGLVLSTSVNAHLYSANRFLMYLTFPHRSGTPSLAMSPYYHRQWKRSSKNAGERSPRARGIGGVRVVVGRPGAVDW